jgi:hypothetical protein
MQQMSRSDSGQSTVKAILHQSTLTPSLELHDWLSKLKAQHFWVSHLPAELQLSKIAVFSNLLTCHFLPPSRHRDLLEKLW